MYTLTEQAAHAQAAIEIEVNYSKAIFHYGTSGDGRQWVMAEGPNGYSSKYYYS